MFSCVFVSQEAALTHVNVDTPHAAIPVYSHLVRKFSLSQLTLFPTLSINMKHFLLVCEHHLSPVMGVVLQMWQRTL